MARTIVSIMSEQTIPNYIFIREHYRLGDKLMFISSKKMEGKVEWIVKTLGFVLLDPIQRVVFEEENDEEKWDKMTTLISSQLSKDEEYVVNLTCGTKYMSLVILQTFEKFKSKFHYIPYPKNYVLSPNDSKANSPITYRLGVEEYMKLYGLSIRTSQTVKSKSYSQCFYQKFIAQLGGNEQFYSVMGNLRCYRDYNIDIQKVENLTVEEETEKKKAVKGLSKFLDDINFPMEKEGKLSKYEVRYLTGGWFEEYIYHLIEDQLKPNDIKIGVTIVRTTNTNMNDLDVVFTLGNKLFVIECKTGVSGRKLFGEIVYKASALKEYLLGISSHSYIFSLSNGDKELIQTAKNMGTNYCDRTFFTDEAQLNELIAKIKQKAYDN